MESRSTRKRTIRLVSRTFQQRKKEVSKEMKGLSYEVTANPFHVKMRDVAGVAVDSQDNIYYTTRNMSGDPAGVMVHDPEGGYLYGFGGGILRNPHGICVDCDDNVLVTDAIRNCVFKFSKTGELLMTIGTPDAKTSTGCLNYDFKTVKAAGGPFGHPAKIDTTAEGEIYVADGYGNCCVHHFAKDGRLLHSWGNPGSAPGAFNILHGIGVDRETNDVYVCDRENFRVQVFTADGELKAVWNDIWRPTDVAIQNGLVYVSEIGDMIFVDNVLFTPGGSEHKHFSRVRIFDKQGRALEQIGGPDGGAPGSFLAAHGLCLDSRSNLYVAEVSIPWADVWTAYPDGNGMTSQQHNLLQKFTPGA